MANCIKVKNCINSTLLLIKFDISSKLHLLFKNSIELSWGQNTVLQLMDMTYQRKLTIRIPDVKAFTPDVKCVHAKGWNVIEHSIKLY